MILLWNLPLCFIDLFRNFLFKITQKYNQNSAIRESYPTFLNYLYANLANFGVITPLNS